MLRAMSQLARPTMTCAIFCARIDTANEPAWTLEYLLVR